MTSSNGKVSDDGAVSITVTDDSTPQATFKHGSLTWNNITYTIDLTEKDENKKPKTRTLLSNVCGEAKRGELVAIMGSSGAGKTTLLNCLSGRLATGHLSGSILLDNQPRQIKTWKRVMAFVEQDDALYANLTVRETLRFASRLRLPSSQFSAHQRDAQADDILKSLRLTKAADTFIGDGLTRGVSGGERKRVAIGQELVGNPEILFLDEPTSGLDSNSALAVLENVKAEAVRTGRIVVLTIHQPSYEILSLFSKVTLLAGGSTVFYGPVDEAVNHFATLGYPCPPRKNPADWFLDLLTIEEETAKEDLQRIQGFHEAYRQLSLDAPPTKEISKEVDITNDVKLDLLPSTSTDPVGWSNSWLVEFGILFERAWLDILRDKPVMIASFARTFVLVILMGFAFFQLDKDQRGIQNRSGILFLWPINQVFVTIQPIVATFPLERVIMLRERSAGSYRVSSFYTAKVISQLLPAIGFSMLACIPLYWMMGLQPQAWKFFAWLLINAVEVAAAVGLGFMVSSGVPTVQMAMAVAPLITVVFLLFGGQVINNASLGWWFKWMHYISPIGYAYRAFMQTEFRGLQLSCQPGEPCTPTGELVLQQQDLNDLTVWTCAGVLAALAAWWFLTGYALLRKTSKPKMKVL
ncbi:P-loop containing nucleoside triphosphate hydrolase protein [Phlyctochytrium arcticum]|nr:P-loop containing nucleoside triphosphate hydrolase protein [Phlyctochytrium arcticum]